MRLGLTWLGSLGGLWSVADFSRGQKSPQWPKENLLHKNDQIKSISIHSSKFETKNAAKVFTLFWKKKNFRAEIMFFEIRLKRRHLQFLDNFQKWFYWRIAGGGHFSSKILPEIRFIRRKNIFIKFSNSREKSPCESFNNKMLKNCRWWTPCELISMQIERRDILIFLQSKKSQNIF